AATSVEQSLPRLVEPCPAVLAVGFAVRQCERAVALLAQHLRGGRLELTRPRSDGHRKNKPAETRRAPAALIRDTPDDGAADGDHEPDRKQQSRDDSPCLGMDVGPARGPSFDPKQREDDEDTYELEREEHPVPPPGRTQRLAARDEQREAGGEGEQDR